MPRGSSAALIARIAASLAGIAVAFQIADLQPPDAMLGADRAAHRIDHIMHQRLDRLALVFMIGARFAPERERRCNAGCRRPDGQSS